MAAHYNIVVMVREVQEPEPIRDGSGKPTIIGHPNSSVAMTERRVIDRLNLTVSAPTEAEAYQRAIQMLQVSQPFDVHEPKIASR